MGFFLPLTLGRGEGYPGPEQCREELFGAMVEKCVVEGNGMAGMRNVRMLPGRGSMGRGIVEGKGRFVVVREVLEGVNLDEE